MDKEGKEEDRVKRIRITLCSQKVKEIEATCAKLVKDAKDKGLDVKGPVRIPTKRLRITTRKTPCGEGSKTWDRFQLRIHKRVIDLKSPYQQVKESMKLIDLDPDVDLEVTMMDD